MKKETEIFLNIPNFENYQVSNFGRIRNIELNHFIKGRPNTAGYYQVTLYNDRGESKMFLIHRLVAETFLPNMFNYEQVDHIDENKRNNFVGTPEKDFTDGNLRWVSSKENINHGTGNKRRIESKKKNKTFIICRYDLEGNLVEEYTSLIEAARAVGGRTDSIRWTLNGKLKTSYGYIWKRKLKKEYTKQYYEEHKEEIIKKQMEYYEKNKEEINTIRREVYKQKTEKNLKKSQKNFSH